MNSSILAVSSLFLLGFVFGCQSKADRADLDRFRGQAKVEAENLAVVKSMWEAWGKGDYEEYRKGLASGYVWIVPSGGANALPVEKTIEMGKLMRQAFPDVTFSIEDMFAAKDRVVTRFIMRATHRGEFQGIPATGKRIELCGIAIVRLENGKVVEEREDSDMLGLMGQLGLELKPKEAQK